VIEATSADWLASDGISKALGRTRQTQPPHTSKSAGFQGQRRLLGGMTLHDLAGEYV